MKDKEVIHTAILNSLRAHIAVLDKTGKIITTNKAWDDFAKEKHTNLLRAASIGANYLSILKKSINQDSDIKKMYDGIVMIMSGKDKYFSCEFSNLSSNGQRWGTIRVTPYDNKGGVVISYTNITKTILAEKEAIKAKEKLKESEILLRKVIDSSPNSIYIKDKNGYYILVNKRMAELHNTTPEALTGTLDLKLGEKWLSNKEKIEKYRASELDVIYKKQTLFIPEEIFIFRDGRKRWFQTTKLPINIGNNVNCIMCVAVDITERKQVEAALRKSEKFLKETANMGRVGGWEFNIDTLELIWAENTYNIHELELGTELSIEMGIKFYTLNSRPIIEEAVQRAIEFREPFNLELEIITAKNNLRNVHVIGQVDLTDRKVYGFFQDISERKKPEELLKLSEKRLKEAQRIAKLGNWELDLVNNVLYWSEEAQSIFEYDLEKHGATYETFLSAIHPDDVGIVDKAYTAHILDKKPYSIEHRIITPNGAIKHVREKCESEFNKKGKAIISKGTTQDITESKKIEKEKIKTIIHAQERERQRLATDLHDGVGQTIAAANMHINALTGMVKDQLDAETYTTFKTTKKLINDATAETRFVSHNIMPPSLKEYGLEHSVINLIGNYQQVTAETNFKIKSNIKTKRFSKEIEWAAYRSIQEMISNAVKHAKAKNIKVELNSIEKQFTVKVTDDGIGFDSKKITKKKEAGMGLANLAQRTHVLGGEFLVKTGQKKGTKVSILFKNCAEILS